jgi:signal transduction histidine kinase
MKSERLKTELITNVSHDLKTPLTSIVNYVDLMKKEDIQPEKAKEYLEVLDRQSKRLKKLTLDLLEASKASTGNISVSNEPTNIKVLLSQLEGEYAEKLAASNLELHVSVPEEDMWISADGRLLSRVFDNLMNNIFKYTQPGTRVYVTARAEGENSVIEFKNISKYQLNISGDELMERFVRGDSSRNTEGSGLGLSIAKSLTELQNGELDIVVDGDLFKAIVSMELTPPEISFSAEDVEINIGIYVDWRKSRYCYYFVNNSN